MINWSGRVSAFSSPAQMSMILEMHLMMENSTEPTQILECLVTTINNLWPSLQKLEVWTLDLLRGGYYLGTQQLSASGEQQPLVAKAINSKNRERSETGTSVAFPIKYPKGIVDGVVFMSGPKLTLASRQCEVLMDHLTQTFCKFNRVLQNSRRTSILQALLKSLSSKTDPNLVISAIIDAGYKLIGCERVTLFLVDHENKVLRLAVSKDATGNAIPMNQGIAGHVATTSQPLLIDNVYGHPLFDSTMDKRTGFVTKSMLALPVPGRQDAGGGGGNSCLAVLQFVNKNVGVFDEYDLSLATLLAENAGITMSKALLFKEMLFLNKKSNGLLQLVQTVHSNIDMVGLIESIVNICYGLLSADRITLFVVDPIKKELWTVLSKEIEGVRIPIGKGIVGHTALKGVTMNIRDAYHCDFFDKTMDLRTGYRTRAVLCVPVKDPVSDTVIAVVQAINKVPLASDFVSAPSISPIVLRPSSSSPSLFSSSPLPSSSSSSSSTSADASSAPAPAPSSSSSSSANPVLSVTPSGVANSNSNNNNNSSNNNNNNNNNNGGVAFILPERPRSNTNELDSLTNEYFSVEEASLLEVFCLEVANALKRRSMEMALAKAASDEGHQNILTSFVVGYTQREIVSMGIDLETGSTKMWPLLRERQISRKSSSNPISQQAAATYYNWNLDVFAIAANDNSDSIFLDMIENMFQDLNLFTDFLIPKNIFSNFIVAVRALYHDENPFHNFKHAFSVLQMTYMLLKSSPGQYLTKLEALACMIAAYCHDVDHPGNSNAFQITTSSPLAILYNDKAVLENHHCCQTFRLLQDPTKDILAKLSPVNRREIRKLIISGILSTDMSLHGAIVESSQKLAKVLQTVPAPQPQQQTLGNQTGHLMPGKHQPSSSNTTSTSSSTTTSTSTAADASSSGPQATAPALSDENRLALMHLIVHCSDLSAQTLETALALKWGNCIVNEFRKHAESEIALGLEPAPFMKKLDTNVDVAKLQIGFIDYILTPLWDSAVTCFPSLSHRKNNLVLVRQAYDELMNKEDL